MKPKRAPMALTHPQPLTPTEEEMLRIISVYRYMTALDMAYSLGTPKTLTRVRSRLTHLAGGTDYQDRAFLYRFPLPSNKGGNRERVFTLGAAGREVVESFGMPVDWYYRPSKTGRLSGSHLAHQLLVTRFVVAAQQWTNAQPDYSLAEMRLSFEIERNLGTRRGEVVVPDAWLHFARVGGRKSPVLLEIDRGSEYQERFKNHVRGRIEFLRSGDYARIFRFNRTNVPKPSQHFDQCVQNHSMKAQVVSQVQNPLTVQSSGTRSPIESWSFSSEKSYSPWRLICCQVTTEPWRTAMRSACRRSSLSASASFFVR
jgi:hypothetical protein